jgi:hypothetical protein
VKSALLLLCLGMLGCAIWALAPSDLRKAFDHHQSQEYPAIKAYYPQLGGEGFVLSERWKNYQKYAKDCPAIAEVVKVVVSKTSDGGEYVIELKGPSARIGADGFEKDVCSLWIRGSGENQELDVRDFTSY